MVPENLYHYTSLDALECILKNQTIRFTPLNKLDDLQEPMSADAKTLGQYIFTSSWSSESDEMIPMWHMYAQQHAGVRISLKSNPFHIYYYTPKEFSKYFPNPNNVDLDTVIPMCDIANDYCIIPYKPNLQLFQIQYTDDHEKLFPRLKTFDNNHFSCELLGLGKHKNTSWEFQKEWRYSLLIIPFSLQYMYKIINLENSFLFLKLINEILNGTRAIPFDYYYMKISDYAFSNMQIVLGAKMSTNQKEFAKQIVSKYNPMATVTESILTNQIR